MLIPFLVILALLVLVPTILWGFPGPWALPAILPAFIGAATFKHIKLPRDQRTVGPHQTPGPALRPGVMVLGGLFTLGTGAVALILMWAAGAPSTIVIASEVEISAGADRVWADVIDVRNRSKWSPWMADAEPIGRGGELAAGSQFRGRLALERGYPVQAELAVTTFDPEARFAWRITPLAEAKLQNLTETVTLERRSDVTTFVRYEITYDVPTVMGRVAERIAVRGSVERLAATTTDLLRQRVLMPR